MMYKYIYIILLIYITVMTIEDTVAIK